jgi:glycosyltransferase involved in cell wall biosynthesis
MRVGFFTYGMNQKLTGIGRYAVELTRALKTLEPTLDILLLNPYPSSELAWYKEFETYPVPQLRLMPYAASLGNFTLHQAAKKLNLDILHDPCGIAPFISPGGYKKITTVHDAIPFIYPETQPLLTRLVFQTLIRAAKFTADAVITVSEDAAKDIQHHIGIAPNKLHVTPNGVHPAPTFSEAQCQQTLQQLGISKSYFLYVGALHPRKNLSRVLEAFTPLSKTYSETQLVIVGPPSWGANETLAEILENAKASKRVLFTNYVSDEVLHQLYGGAHALVFPSLYEGFGLPALEAMSHGTPVITSNVSSLPEVVGDAALLVDPKSVDAIREAMARLLTDAALRHSLSVKGKARAAKFTWQETARKTLEIYKTVMAKTTVHDKTF